MFIGEKSNVTDTAELSACLDESFANLELMGVECAIDIPGKNSIDIRDAIPSNRLWICCQAVYAISHRPVALSCATGKWILYSIRFHRVIFKLLQNCRMHCQTVMRAAE